ncbi:hypothetical protein GG681_07450 [Epibacterium sp. SM1969]|uniref:50S ribosomal protein L35 n=1 Tax=Tritonibacter aquimaris TaxID=2663379 RepID=A0A844AVQ2_9RHOB|nr:hypothetical protein [Tritonibacter aquimaris]MQY42474.1 hypothetical protein [Tritonibacter aquimaris]
MDPDLCLVVGLALGLLSVPALLSAISDSRAPRSGGLTLLAAAGLVAYAVMQKPGGYSLEEIPDVVLGVIGSFV